MENKEDNMELIEYFKEVKLTKPYEGYFCSVMGAITIVILGTFCGFKNVKQIHQWASHEKTEKILKEKFGVESVPCYYWLLCLLKILEPKSMSECFTNWVMSVLPETLKNKTISLDGKTIRSTSKMDKYENPIHIVSAQIAEFGMTLGQISTESKSNEIPAVRELIKILDISETVIVADALNCQKETAELVTRKGADYIFSVKDNQPTTKKDIEDYIKDPILQKSMDFFSAVENQSGRIEKRISFTTTDVSWLNNKDSWSNLKTIGAINTQFTTKKGTSNEWHYYISSKNLTAEELLHYSRNEWSVESMHWLLDVHFSEDFCRVADDNIQKNLNIIRKIVINSIRNFKAKTNSKAAFSHIMLDCLIDVDFIKKILISQN